LHVPYVTWLSLLRVSVRRERPTVSFLSPYYYYLLLWWYGGIIVVMWW